MDIIETESGNVSGVTIGEFNKKVSLYLGIPYAAPPVGDFRWQPPQPVKKWSGVLHCTKYRASCPQFGGALPFMEMEQSEDCLYLNVATPAQKASDKLPVMVWFHGGGLDSGSGNDPLFNNYRLPLNGIVQVSVVHRLGALGLLAHRTLSEESPNGVSGNYLFLDLIASLKWVQENIDAFGGDPGNVTIFGESGGGMKVHCLLASPMAKGLFHRAICQSGSDDPDLFRGKNLKEAEVLGEKLFATLGVKTLQEARRLDYRKIVKGSMVLVEEMKMPLGLWTTTVDNSFLYDTPAATVLAGKHNVIPLLLGANLGELGPGIISLSNLISDYLAMFTGNIKAGSRGYAYIFDQVPAGWRALGGEATHAMELPYVFGDYDNSTPLAWKMTLNLQTFYGITTEDPGLTAKDKEVSTAMMKMWSQFARTGDPNVNGLPEWPVWEPLTDRYLHISESIKAVPGFSRILSSDRLQKLKEKYKDKVPTAPGHTIVVDRGKK